MKKSELRNLIREELIKVQSVKQINESVSPLFTNKKAKKLSPVEKQFQKKIIDILNTAEDEMYFQAGDMAIKSTNYGITYNDADDELCLVFIDNEKLTMTDDKGVPFGKEYINMSLPKFKKLINGE